MFCDLVDSTPLSRALDPEDMRDLLQSYQDRIVDNLFRGNKIAIYCNQTKNTPLIKGNRFEQNEMALINFSFAYPAVEDNRFIANTMAIRNDQYGSPLLENNLFKGNETALYNYRKSNPKVLSNRFEGNQLAMFCDFSSYPEVKQKVKEIVENEDKSSPLSDDDIVTRLKTNYGVQVARRTVTKYRKALGIPWHALLRPAGGTSVPGISGPLGVIDDHIPCHQLDPLRGARFPPHNLHSTCLCRLAPSAYDPDLSACFPSASRPGASYGSLYGSAENHYTGHAKRRYASFQS